MSKERKESEDKMRSYQDLAAKESTERKEAEGGKKMSRDDAQDKGKDILALMAELYQLIEWEGDEQDGDPYLKMTFYKSGKFTIETYKDNDVSEFTIDEIINN